VVNEVRNEKNEQEFLDFCIAYISSVRWQNAKTYIKAPHEYTVVHWDYKKKSDFERMVEGIRKFGYQEKFGNQTFTYLNIDGKKYWTMGAPLPETTLINRANCQAPFKMNTLCSSTTVQC